MTFANEAERNEKISDMGTKMQEYIAKAEKKIYW